MKLKKVRKLFEDLSYIKTRLYFIHIVAHNIQQHNRVYTFL